MIELGRLPAKDATVESFALGTAQSLVIENQLSAVLYCTWGGRDPSPASWDFVVPGSAYMSLPTLDGARQVRVLVSYPGLVPAGDVQAVLWGLGLLPVALNRADRMSTGNLAAASGILPAGLVAINTNVEVGGAHGEPASVVAAVPNPGGLGVLLFVEPQDLANVLGALVVTLEATDPSIGGSGVAVVLDQLTFYGGGGGAAPSGGGPKVIGSTVALPPGIQVRARAVSDGAARFSVKVTAVYTQPAAGGLSPAKTNPKGNALDGYLDLVGSGPGGAQTGILSPFVHFAPATAARYAILDVPAPYRGLALIFQTANAVLNDGNSDWYVKLSGYAPLGDVPAGGVHPGDAPRPSWFTLKEGDGDNGAMHVKNGITGYALSPDSHTYWPDQTGSGGDYNRFLSMQMDVPPRLFIQWRAATSADYTGANHGWDVNNGAGDYSTQRADLAIGYILLR